MRLASSSMKFWNNDASERLTAAQLETNRFTQSALDAHKREGLLLAVRARWVALAVIAVMLPFLNRSWEVLYFYPFIAVLALNGWAQYRIGQVGRSGAELLLLFVDLALMTFMLTFPPPFPSYEGWPTPMTYRFGNFVYFFVILAAGTLSYNWRTIMAVGNWTLGLWLIGVAMVWAFGRYHPDVSSAFQQAIGHEPEMLELIDPNHIHLEARVQEVVVFLIVSYTLALMVRRFHRLILRNAALTRERENLSRYFSPNVVEELSQNDDPLREVREQDVVVLFADLVGFTSYAASHPPREVIETLRAFHTRMERCVFAHEGTLDKYMGDGLMATFGTPLTRPDDAERAIACARQILRDIAELNAEREIQGLHSLQVSVGLHAGPVVLGDIGASRLEFAVIGNTVNVASRMESLTRQLGTSLVLSDDMRALCLAKNAALGDFACVRDQAVRGLPDRVTVWALEG